MYERFTDSARKAMQLANEEAKRFHHEYIGTEHILLGLVKEGTNVAADVLENLGIDLRKIRLEVEKIVQAGPDRFAMGKLPQTPRAKKVVELAIEEARSLDHNYVGTEHLLLGLLREDEGVAVQVLMNLGVHLPDVRMEVLTILGKKPDTGIVDLNRRPPTPSTDASSDLRNLPDHAQKIALEFDWHIKQLRREKEAAVAGQDFNKATKLRDDEHKLIKQRESFIAEWRDEATP